MTTVFVLFIVLVIGACTFPANLTPVSVAPTVAEATQVVPATTVESATHKTYTNSQFGLSFQFPTAWFGPEEYFDDQTLHVEVGSDKVYPYGTGFDERTYDVKNSYSVVIQYSRNDQNSYWKETYEALSKLQDHESISDQRGLTIRFRQVSLGRFNGFEFISTLSESAQSEPVYMRQVILYDDQSNMLSIVATPNNVEVSEGSSWRDAYRMVDEANVSTFHEILDSIVVE